MTTHEVAIIGAGIIGMTSAVCLLEKGFNVTVFTKDDPLKTNSDAAIAFWHAPEDESHKPILQKLCLESRAKFEELCETENSGVQKIPIIYYYKNKDMVEQSIWMKKSLKIKLDYLDHIEHKAFSKAILIYNFLIDANIYRKYLLERFLALGGKLEIKKIDNLMQLVNLGIYNPIVLSAGWESKYLTEDKNIYPVRGQIEIAKMPKYLKNYYSVSIRENDTYVIFRPQSQDCILGTTYQINDTEREARLTDKDKIITKCLPFLPDTQMLETISKVGIRCGRSDARIETENLVDTTGQKILLIHCYGHGSSGFSASWGSAYKILEHCLQYVTTN